MDFALDEDQQALLDLARQIFADRCHDQAIQAFANGSAPYDAGLWQTLVEAGLVGVGIPEVAGGNGFGMIETALLLEAAGAALAPVPLLDVVVAAQTLAECGDAHFDWVRRAVGGEAILSSALEEVGAAFASPACVAQRDGDGWRVSGTRSAVRFGMEADLLLVAARIGTGDAAGLFAVPTSADGVARVAQQGTDLTPLAQVDLEGVRLPSSAQLGDAALLRRHVGRMRVAFAAQQLGIAGEALRRTAAYTSERVQFGRPVGSMQAVQQRAADGFIDVEAMRSSLWRAAWLIDRQIFDEAEIATAKYWAAIGGHRVTHTAQHQHGGVGADVTYPIHRFFLAARANESALGGSQPMLTEIGAAIANGTARRLAAIGGSHDAI